MKIFYQKLFLKIDMPIHLKFLAVALVCVFSCNLQAVWLPANGPLTTRWTKKVSPDNALPEYPRPQLARAAWLNLNGLWVK